MRRILPPLLLYRGGLLLVVWTALRYLPPLFNESGFAANFHWQPLPSGLGDRFSTWDAQHYLALSEHGYRASAESLRFFPLWPWLVRAAAALSPFHSPLAAGLLLSNLFAAAGAYLFHELVAREQGARAAELAALALLAYPAAFFFAFPYSESLFFLLCVSFKSLLRRGNLPAAAAMTFLMPLCRAPGVLVAVPLAHALWSRGHLKVRDLLYFAPLALGGALYLGLMWRVAGHPLAGLADFGALMVPTSPGKALDVVGLLKALLSPNTQFLFGRAAFLLFLASLAYLWRWDRGYFWFALPMGLVPALTSSFWGYLRYSLMAFPIFIAFGRALSSEARRPWAWALLALSFALQLLLLLRHVNAYWVG